MMFASEGAIVVLSSFFFFSVVGVVVDLMRGSSTQLMKCVSLIEKINNRNEVNFIPFTSIGNSNKGFGLF